MTQKLAIKKLTASDLTIFKWHVDNHPAGKQKAINLNANVLVSQLFPSLPTIIEEREGRIPISLHIYGPGLANELSLQRKIQKLGSYKNYRLNGEAINDPDENPKRFHILQAGDFAIMDFSGELEPVSAKVVFVAQSNKSDKTLHNLLEEFISGGSMSVISPAELLLIIDKAKLPLEHPANLLIQDSPLEDAALGGIDGITALRQGPYKGKVSRQTLEQARKNAQKMGRIGEELVYTYLETKKNGGIIKDFVWEADDNAIAPYDFHIIGLDNIKVFIDVKATKGSFSNPIHISYNELLKMREAERYQIYRVSDISEHDYQLRISENMKSFASQVIDVFTNLPEKVQPDGISLPPTALKFGEVIEINIEESSL